jgi:5-methylcytosine-specific restriction endonuclease McrA
MAVFSGWKDRASFLQAIRTELLSKFGVCWFCGCPLPLARWASVDHEVPRSRGGADAPENLLLSCHRCNRRKGDRLLDEGIVVQLRRGSGLFAKHDAIRRGLVDRERETPVSPPR